DNRHLHSFPTRRSSDLSEVVTLERQGAVAVITVNNPPVNALGVAVRDGLQKSFSAAEADAEVKAIVLVCEGNTFIAGADIKEFGDRKSTRLNSSHVKIS